MAALNLNTLLDLALAASHVLAAAAWFGAMFYSYAVLHPRAARFFGGPEALEPFIVSVSAGARWKVLGGVLLLALSGLGLALRRGSLGPAGGWLALIAAKGALLVVTTLLFGVVSWRLWPERLMAAPREIAAHQRRFRRVAEAMLLLVGLNIVLGVAAHLLRAG